MEDAALRLDDDGYPAELIKRSDSEESILKRWRRFRSQAASHVSEVHERAEENWDFASATGDQWDREDRNSLEKDRRPVSRIDDVGPVVKSIAGREVTSRYQPKVYPPTDEDAGPTDAWNEVVRHERARGRWEHEESDAFHDLQIQAYSWIHYQTQVRNGRLPHTSAEPVPLWEMSWDPRSRRPNLQDREWHCRRRWIDVDVAARRWPKAKEKIEEIKASDRSEGPVTFDGDSHESSRRAFAYENATEEPSPSFKTRTNEIRVDELEWKESEAYREIEILDFQAYAVFAELFPRLVEVPPELLQEPTEEDAMMVLAEQFPDGQAPPEMLEDVLAQMTEQFWAQHSPEPEALELSVSDFDRFADRYAEVVGRPFDDYLELERDVYRFAILSGHHVLDHGRRPEEYWTYLVMVGWPHKKKDETLRYGPVDVMKDPQKWVNRFYSLQIELLATAPKNPILAGPSAFDNPGEVRAQLSRPNAVIETRDPTAVTVLKTSSGMPEVDGMFEFAKSRVSGSLGLNPYSLGQVTDLKRTAASSVQSVTQSASTILSQMFDALRLHRIESTQLLLRKMKAYWTEEDVARVVGPKLAQMVPPKREWGQALDYDVRIDEVPATPTQKMEVWESLMQTGFLQQALATPYAPPPEIFVGLFPHLSEADKELWLNTIKQQQEAAAAQPPPEEGAPEEQQA